MRYTCVRCDAEFFDDTPHEIEDNHYGVVCNRCWRNYTRDCDDCCERFCEDAYSSRETSDREANDLTDYCLSCGAEQLEQRREDEKRERELAEELARADEERKAIALALQNALMCNRFARMPSSVVVVVSQEVSR